MDKKADLTREWIKKADHDLGMAELALNNKPEYTDSICSIVSRRPKNI